MKQPRLTAAVIALDEEQNLPGLLDRLAFADEVVLVDGGSLDRTAAVAASYGAKVYHRPFDHFAAQRNYALAVAAGDWILSIDADERPTPALAREIRQRIAGCRQDAFRLRIRSSIFGRHLRFSGTQDDRPIRLVRRGSARWTGNVHEVLRVPGRVGQLTGWLDHETLPDLDAFLVKMNRYTTLTAHQRVAKAAAPGRWSCWTRPPREVFRRLIWKQGLLDGPQGWAFCGLGGLSEWVLARKHQQLWNPTRLHGHLYRRPAAQPAVTLHAPGCT